MNFLVLLTFLFSCLPLSLGIKLTDRDVGMDLIKEVLDIYINATGELVYSTDFSPHSPDPDCIVFLKPDWFEKYHCMLPSKCGVPQVLILEHHIVYKDLIMCYSSIDSGMRKHDVLRQRFPPQIPVEYHYTGYPLPMNISILDTVQKPNKIAAFMNNLDSRDLLGLIDFFITDQNETFFIPHLCSYVYAQRLLPSQMLISESEVCYNTYDTSLYNICNITALKQFQQYLARPFAIDFDLYYVIQSFNPIMPNSVYKFNSFDNLLPCFPIHFPVATNDTGTYVLTMCGNFIDVYVDKNYTKSTKHCVKIKYNHSNMITNIIDTVFSKLCELIGDVVSSVAGKFIPFVLEFLLDILLTVFSVKPLLELTICFTVAYIISRDRYISLIAMIILFPVWMSIEKYI